MKALIVGAGASKEESRRSGLPSEAEFPLVSNFARVMWKHYRPEPFLSSFLKTRGVPDEGLGTNAFKNFLELEQSGQINVEQFYEFCWHNRSTFDALPSAWHDMLHFCFLLPITTAMITQFFENGVGWRPLRAGKLVSAFLDRGDLVVNLNYDTVFEMALQSVGKSVSYLPNLCKKDVLIAKPHGSVNLLVNEKSQSFCFGDPEIAGTAVPTEDDSLAASILPPRLNKKYFEHPIAKTIMDSTRSFAPSETVFWGIGFAQSDLDLNALYRRFAMTSDFISVINPDKAAADAASMIVGRAVLYFADLDEWLLSRGLEVS